MRRARPCSDFSSKISSRILVALGQLPQLGLGNAAASTRKARRRSGSFSSRVRRTKRAYVSEVARVPAKSRSASRERAHHPPRSSRTLRSMHSSRTSALAASTFCAKSSPRQSRSKRSPSLGATSMRRFYHLEQVFSRPATLKSRSSCSSRFSSLGAMPSATAKGLLCPRHPVIRARSRNYSGHSLRSPRSTRRRAVSFRLSTAARSAPPASCQAPEIFAKRSTSP